MTRSAHLEAALEAAAAAADVIRGLYRRNVRVEVKADKTPVTEADIGAERAIRAVLESLREHMDWYEIPPPKEQDDWLMQRVKQED